jgi:DnaJ-class molecular chaperone|uniref:J domain-containing protein n=1 Tax=Desulfobacca acetoxidans TaxID=60893 RepID=A0A7C3YZN3_9BACT
MALDYYDILGVPPKADAGEIRKAYRLLALKWHPDRNPGDPWATSRFLRLGEAYRVLIDPARRAAYDRLRALEKEESRSRSGHQAGAAVPASSPPRRSPRSAAQTRQTGRMSRSRRQERQGPSLVRPAGTQRAVSGFAPWLLFLRNLARRLRTWLAGRPPAALEMELFSVPDQPDLVMELRLPRWLAAQGAKVNFVIKDHFQRRRLKLAIPPGVKDGSWLRIKGGGKNTGPRRGNLYINIRLKD